MIGCPTREGILYGVVGCKYRARVDLGFWDLTFWELRFLGVEFEGFELSCRIGRHFQQRMRRGSKRS